MDPQLGSPFGKLPMEMVLRTSAFLTTPELGALRLTCQKLEKDLFSSFTREFFYKKQFMLTPESLDALVGISQHKTLSPCLRHLVIGLDRYGNHDFWAHRTFLSSTQAIAYRNWIAGQSHLLATGLAATKLAEAFRNLRNLETVDIRDFSSRSRHRDGPQACWTSYGARTIARETGITLSMAHQVRNDDFASQVFTLVLGALAITNARPRNIEVLLRDKTWGLADFAFYLSPSLADSMTGVLSGLKKLHLDIDLKTGTSVILPSGPGGPSLPLDTSAMLLKRFLCSVPNLTWLRLNFQTTSYTDAKSFLRWLALAVSDSRSPIFPSLENLDIGSVEITAETLLAIITKFSAVRGFGFRRVTLHDTKGPSERVNLWAKLFECLAARATLQRLLVGRLSQQKSDGRPCYVVFSNDASPGKPDFERNSARGKEAAPDFLKKLIADSLVLWPEPPDDVDASPDDDTDDE